MKFAILFFALVFTAFWGKSSKAKPGPLLEHSRALYDNLTAVLKDAQNIDFSESSDDFEINQEDLSNLDSFSSDTNDLSLDNLSLDDLPDFSMDDF